MHHERTNFGGASQEKKRHLIRFCYFRSPWLALVGVGVLHPSCLIMYTRRLSVGITRPHFLGQVVCSLVTFWGSRPRTKAVIVDISSSVTPSSFKPR